VARTRLKEALRDRGRVDAAGEITRDTRLSALADLWFAESADEIAEGEKSPNTGRQYRDRLDQQIIPALGGLRLAETAAITWSAVDFQAATVEVRGTVIRIKGQGLVIKPKPKSKSGFRTLELPTSAVAMLRRRKPDDAKPGDPVFTAPMGGIRDPSNTNADLKEAFAGAGYPRLTSHIYRKTVASMMDDAGLSARAAADQLGHAKVSMTQDRYMKRRVTKTGAAGVLESLASEI
jgi:integrase